MVISSRLIWFQFVPTAATILLMLAIDVHFLYGFKMNTTRHIDVYYPPEEPTPTNLVGSIDITTTKSGATAIHREFLGKQLGEDVLIAGKLLRERRIDWATKRAVSRLLFYADAVLGTEIPGRFTTDPDLQI